MKQVEETIKRFILENFLFTSDPDGIANDTSFLEKGIIDSTGVLELVGFLEDTFGIQVEDDEVVPANLDCIDSLVQYVRGKKTGMSQAPTHS